MASYWRLSVHVDGRCVVSMAGDTLAAAISRGVQDAVYYQAIHPGAKVCVTEIREQCSRCHNDGTVTVRKPRSVKVVKCSMCGGKGAHGTVDDIPFTMPDAANGIRLVQSA